MKKALLSVVFTLGLLTAFGQFKKSDLKLTISALPLFGSTEGFEAVVNGMVVKPSIGCFISDRTSIDLNFSYATMNNLTVGSIDSYYDSYAFIPALRNYFVNKPKLRLFAEIGYGLGVIKYNADNNDFRNVQHEQLTGGISILNVGVGGNYCFTDKFGLEIIIPYLNTRNITSGYSNNLYNGIGPTFGVIYKLN